MTNERVDDSDISMAQHGRQDVEDLSGLYGGLSVEWCNMRPSHKVVNPGALTINWGFDLQQERSFENGRMVHQCHRLVVDLFVMKAG